MFFAFFFAIQASDAGVALGDVAILGWCDFNAPYARSKENCSGLCKGLAAINEVDPTRNASIIIMPDFARESSLRGLYDEERQVMEEFFALNQACDCRWIDIYARETSKANLRSSTRRFGSGRIVTSATMQDKNLWLNGELAVCGRVIGQNELASGGGAPVAVLPRSSSILIPESASPDTCF